MTDDDPTPPGQLLGGGGVVPGGTDDDIPIVRRVRSGDVEAFEILVRRYERPVYNAVRRIVGNREDARDLAQIAFVKAFKEIHGFDERHRFFSWLYRIAVHEALNHLRRSGRTEPLVGDRTSGVPGPHDDLAARERVRLVEAAVMRLTPEHRAVVLLRHFGDCSYQQIAQALEIPEKTVRSRIFEARRALRSILATMGVVR